VTDSKKNELQDLLNKIASLEKAEAEGAQFTSFTGTKVLVLLVQKVQILTPEELQHSRRGNRKDHYSRLRRLRLRRRWCV
jgi:hypothetical protein